MTRLFPLPWGGHHPAYPTYESPCPPGHPASSFVAWAGIAGTVPLLLPKLLFGGPRYQLSANLASYGLISAVFGGCLWRSATNAATEAFFKEQNIPIPKRKTLDHVGILDCDDFLLSGAAVGIFVASRIRQPWIVVGWKRWASAAVFGATAAMPLGTPEIVRKKGIMGPEQYYEQLTQAREEAKKWMPQILDAFRRRRAQDAESIRSPFRPKPSSTVAQPDPSDPLQAGQPVVIPYKVVSPSEKLGFDLISWPNESNEPHLTAKIDTETGLVAQANTNYTWTPQAGQAVSDLEAHIAKLRQRRQSLAAECEYVWRWLAEKEAEYYNFRGPSDSEEKAKKRRYVEILGNAHTRLWLDVNKCDWMIADSQKRIEQFRSANASEDGNITWLPPISAGGSDSASTAAQGVLKSFQLQTEARKAAIESTRAQMASNLTGPDVENTQGKFSNPLNGEKMDAKDILSDLRKFVESETENVRVDGEAVDNVVKDGEERIAKARSR